VTGGASGIGQAVVKLLVNRGYAPTADWNCCSVHTIPIEDLT